MVANKIIDASQVEVPRLTPENAGLPVEGLAQSGTTFNSWRKVGTSHDTNEYPRVSHDDVSQTLFQPFRRTWTLRTSCSR